MHVYEGILSATASGRDVLLAGAVAAAAGTAVGLYKLDQEKIPRTAVLSSAFFVASLIQVPLGVTSVHLVLSGLMGLVLGWSAFPAVLIALVLQTAFFSPTGPTALGINTVIMALPAVACCYLFRPMACSSRVPVVFTAGFAAGLTAILLGGLLSAAVLVIAGQGLGALAPAVLAVHLPVALVEGFVTANVVVLLRRVRPEVLQSPQLVSAVGEVTDG